LGLFSLSANEHLSSSGGKMKWKYHSVTGPDYKGRKDGSKYIVEQIKPEDLKLKKGKK
jgi:hypothetical protein